VMRQKETERDRERQRETERDRERQRVMARVVQLVCIPKIKDLFSALCDLSKSLLGLKRIPMTSLHRVTQSGRTGVLSLDPML
jgi:hypothetical protein